MNNNLSRQLCELCGIQAKLDGSNPNLSLQPLFPDFGNPENCLKLIKIISNYMDDEDTGISITQNRVSLGDPIFIRTDNSERKLDFKQKILKLLIDGFEFPFENDKKLKQSIREAEWVYE